MPARWMHETFDQIIFGKTYPKVHRQKDAAWKELGSNHRIRNHEWYKSYGEEWDWKNIFPPKLMSFLKKMQIKHGAGAEKDHQVWVAHDVFDKMWDELGLENRHELASALRQLILSPQILKEKFGVDVLEGKILRRIDEKYGFSEQIEYWEDEPSLKSLYSKLRKYVERKSIHELLYLNSREGKYS